MYFKIKTLVFALLLGANIAFAQAKTAPTNLILNGDFQNGNTEFLSDLMFAKCVVHRNGCGEYICSGSYAIGNVPAVCNPDWIVQTRDHTTGYGNLLIVDFPNEEGRRLWQQQVVLKPKTTYIFRFWAINLIQQSATPMLGIRINKVKMGSFTVNNLYNWLVFERQFTTKEGGNTILALHNINTDVMGCDLGIDDISLEEVPDKPRKKETKATEIPKKISEKEKIIPKLSEKTKITPQKSITITDTTKKIVTNAIFWDAAKAEIRPESFAALNDLAAELQKRPNCKITVVSHTDTRGKPENCLVLSIKRSKAIVDYLQTKGIAQERLTYKGMGLSAPLEICANNNCTEAQHQRNRRTEFLVQ